MERQKWVDSAKAIGIFLVFYGHFIESIYFEGFNSAYHQYKFIYAFHMPFFFFITGFFAKKAPDIFSGIRKLFMRRMLPVLTFSLLLLPLWMVYALLDEGFDYKVVLGMALDYLRGRPAFALITWFLICLFVCETYALVIFSRFKSKGIIFIISLIALVGGLYLCRFVMSIEGILGLILNSWYIFGAIVAMGFYLLGYLSYPYIVRYNAKGQKFLWVIIGIISFGILLLSFRWNDPSEGFVIFMIISSHGEILPFLISSFAGILFMLSLASLIPTSGIVQLIGQNTLVFLGLNGIFLHFLNPEIVTRFPPDDNWISITVYALLVSLLSFAVCIPFIKVFNKWIPQLIGKSNQDGPIIPELENNKFATIRIKFNNNLNKIFNREKR